MKALFQRRIIAPLSALLRQGITPRKIALSLACGVVVGVFPVMGSTTLLCAAAALLFRLNLPAVQIVNYFIYPLQLALILPFIRLGETLLRVDRTGLSLSQMVAIFRLDHHAGIHILWRLALHGIFAWTLVAPFFFLGVYRIFLPMTTRMAQTLARRREAAVVMP